MKMFCCYSCLIMIIFAASCQKKGNPDPVVENPGGGNQGGDTVVVINPTDPPVENTIGFFLDGWMPKNFTTPAFTDTTLPGATTYVVTIDASKIITKIPSSVYGQNSNLWMTQMVTEAPLMNHIKNLEPNIIRFPGGSISDVFFWNAQTNQNPIDVPATLVNAEGISSAAGYWYGKNNDWWTLSLQNYYNMLQQTGNEGMITVNYGYARIGTGPDPVAKAAHLAAEWVRHDNGRTKYWEIGNESNGTWETGYRINTATNQDGQPEIITGALYGQHANVFIDSMKKAAQEIGKTIYIGVYLLEKKPASWQTATDHTWNAGVLTQIKDKADYYIIHSYYTNYKTNASADEILLTATENTSAMMNYVKSNLTSAGAAIKPIILNEWNITSEGSKQQVSFVNGMHAAIVLGESLKHKYGMTSRWDFANGWDNGNDHGLFNIGDEPGGVSKWNPRPAFYYMYYFQKMMGDRMLQSTVSGNILAYASSFSSGEKGVVMVNKASTSTNVLVNLQHAKPGSRFYWYTLTGGTENGEFSGKVFVNGKGPTQASGGPANEYATLKPYSATTANGIKVAMPARSVIYLVIGK